MTIKNEKVFIEAVEDSAIIKVKIDEQYKPEMSKLKKLFKMAFGVKPAVFKLINDLQFYKGGYPKETTEPKLQKMLDDIGNAFNFYELREKQDLINGYLRTKYGIEIQSTTGNELARPGIKKLKKFEELYSATFNEPYKLTSKKDLIEKLLTAGQAIENDINFDKDAVAIAAAEMVEAKCEVKKPNFMAAVQMKATAIKKGDDTITDKINEINAKREEFDAVCEVIAPEGE